MEKDTRFKRLEAGLEMLVSSVVAGVFAFYVGSRSHEILSQPFSSLSPLGLVWGIALGFITMVALGLCIVLFPAAFMYAFGKIINDVPQVAE